MTEPKHILIFRPGQLGDSIVALPAIWALREAYPEARISWLHDIQHNKTFLTPKDLLSADESFIQTYISYIYYPSKWANFIERIKLYLKLKKMDVDTLCYLPPSSRPIEHRARDVKFFRSVGVTQILGEHLPVKDFSNWAEADIFVASLESDKIPFPGQLKGAMKLPDACKQESPIQAEANSIAIFVGSNIPEKEFPFESWLSLLTELPKDAKLLFLGVKQDQTSSENIRTEIDRGENLCGKLSIPQTISLLEECAYCIGVDSGGIHLAALAKCPSVVISHGLAEAGRWDPYANLNKVVRATIPGDMSSISPEKVLTAFKEISKR